LNELEHTDLQDWTVHHQMLLQFDYLKRKSLNVTFIVLSTALT